MLYFINIVESGSITGIIVPLIAGAVCIALSIFGTQTLTKLETTGVEAEGVVFDSEQSSGSESRGYAPIIRFVTAEKEWITKKPTIYITSMSALKPGKKVRVFYDPENPEEFIIHNRLLKPITKLLLVIGIIVIGYAMYAAYQYLKL